MPWIGKRYCRRSGFTHWNGGPSSISIYVNDETTNEKDGVDAGDQIIWLAHDSISGLNYKALLNYISGSDIYAVNAINLVSDYSILNMPISVNGCTNEFASNYNPTALLNDASCVFPNNSELLDSIVYLLSIIDSISSEPILCPLILITSSLLPLITKQ